MDHRARLLLDRIAQIFVEHWLSAKELEAATVVHEVFPLPIGVRRKDELMGVGAVQHTGILGRGSWGHSYPCQGGNTLCAIRIRFASGIFMFVYDIKIGYKL